MNAAISSGKMFCEGSLSQEDGLNKTCGIPAFNDMNKNYKQQSRMRSTDSLNSVQSQESGVEKDSRSQSSSSLLEKMSQAIARRKNSDPKADVDGLKVSACFFSNRNTGSAVQRRSQPKYRSDLLLIRNTSNFRWIMLLKSECANPHVVCPHAVDCFNSQIFSLCNNEQK